MFFVEEFSNLKLQLQDVISATDNFDPNKVIGHGGFGKVYKGELSLSERPCAVAFKRLDTKFGQGDTEFWKEIMMLSKCKHENLVSLSHFCFEGDERILVYEYVSRGSLDRYLSDASLTWIQRLKICVGAARGLNYLHDPMETKQRVLHRDIKSSNILLDDEWNAKVSDFGLSKVGPANQPQTYLVSNVVGTFGYCDPLYFETGLLSKESDVYSIGVVLFEVMCGRLCCEYSNGKMIRLLVPMWKKCFEDNKLDDIIFDDIKEQIQHDSLMTFSTIANQCLQRDHKKRPTMVEIVQQLEVAIKQQLGINIIEETDEIKHIRVKLQAKMSKTTTTRICAGCNREIGRRRFLSHFAGVWHPECFRCHACNITISDYEFSMSENRPFHKSCYKEESHPRCDVCKNFIPTNMAGLIEYRAHPFWQQKYCLTHEHDGTPRCCSCERMEPRDTKYFLLDDGRKLCLECLDSAMMDTKECQPLYLDILDFYQGLNMNIEQQVPLLMVERQELNEAMEEEKHGHHHMPETRGLCLSEEQTISTIVRRVGAARIIEPYKLVVRCEVAAILILYSLPRLLTGSILAHEMMHAWLRLKGYPDLPPDVEEGICQVLAHMWLDSEIMAGAASTNVASSSSSAPAAASSKKGKRSHFEQQLGEFSKHQIESDTSAVYGDGFREGNKAVLKHGLKSTLDHIRLTGKFPC